jgi:hypothetical protein
MRHLGFSCAVLAAALLAPAHAEEAAHGAVRGRVSTQTAAAVQVRGGGQTARGPGHTAAASPLARVTVYAYELAQLQVHKVVSGAQGEFSFEQLPAGVYKLIAFKVGYEPAVVMLSRAATDALQFVELRLAAEQASEIRRSEGFWAIREQIPPDVLRDIESVRLAEMAQLPAGSAPRAFSTAVRAMTGVEDLGGGRAAQLAGGGIGMEGSIGALRLDVTGEYWRLAGTDATQRIDATGAEAAALAVRMAGSGEGLIDVTTVSHRMASEELDAAPAFDSADFERYRVSWSQPFGERSRSRFAAQYTSQSNFFRPPSEAAAPNETRALNLEGAYLVDFTERSSLEAGVRYRQQEAAISSAFGDPQHALELFGKGGWRLQPSVLVEYGMFTQLRDGSWALAPQGGVVVQLGQHWQAQAGATYRLEEGDVQPLDGVTPLRFSSAGDGCRDLEQSCYRVMLAHQGDNDGLFAVGVIHRQMAETLHLYFDDDFLNQLESVYLVEGDELPEVQLVVERRLTPRVLARLESSYARGGGGILYAVGDTPHENRVRYLVTSVDTRFQQSSTGVFVAFHRVEQGAAPAGTDSAQTITVSELDRLQLMLSQDLNVLARLAADWAVQVNFELSRGSLPFTLTEEQPDDLRRRVTGGLSVKF